MPIFRGYGNSIYKAWSKFLATKLDIIGDEIANKLEKLQDKLPAFNTKKLKLSLKGK